jgi:hypothetical protein
VRRKWRKYCRVTARTAKRGQVSNFAVFLRNSLPVPGLPLADHTPYNLRRTTLADNARRKLIDDDESRGDVATLLNTDRTRLYWELYVKSVLWRLGAPSAGLLGPPFVRLLLGQRLFQ